MAVENLKPYGERIFLLKKGLYSADQCCSFGGGGTIASIQDNTDDLVECISMPTLLNQYSISTVDILKMDIEGAEEAIFCRNPESWLDRIKLLIIEFHGANNIRNQTLNVLRQHNFIRRQYRSLWYCMRSDRF